MNTPNHMSDYIEFYRNRLPIRVGRKAFFLCDILGTFSPKDLENNHKYIQWLFPNAELSKMQPTAARQVLTPEAAATMRGDAEIAAGIGRSVEMMMRFWGMDPSDGTIANEKLFMTKLGRRRDHNRLRITRMLKFLRTLGGRDEFVDAVKRTLLENANLKTDPVAKRVWEAV